MRVDMASNIKCLLVIFSVLYQVASECQYSESYCTLEVFCDADDLLSFVDLSYTDVSNCDNLIRTYNDNYLIPMRITIKGHLDVAEKIPQGDSDEMMVAVTELDITNSNLRITPTLNAMDNLKKLNLSNNNLRLADLFNEVELIKLQDIDLSYNIITSIQVDKNKFVYKNLRKINLSHNILNNISGGVFASFEYLEFLDLSYNNLAVIDLYTFEGLNNLEYLYMSHNSFIGLNSSLFRFVHLKELYLDNNKLEKLFSRDFETLQQLQELNLDFNYIPRIEKDTFNSTVSLSTVKLHHNSLNYIDKDAFMSTHELKAVDISDNLLKTLPRNLFQNKFISSFSISGNNLEGALTRGSFEGIHVTELDISFQGIIAVEDYAFVGLEQLTVLLLNNNKICSISYNAFNSLKKLNMLDLSNNLITYLNFDTSDLLNLQTYYLKKNFIGQIRHDHFRDLKKLCNLDLSYNNITKFESNSFTLAENLENLQIFHNPLNGILLQNTFAGLSSVLVLDLSYTSLTTIQNGSFSGMVKMYELNISRSLINILEYGAFKNTSNLKLIDLSYNKLIDFFVNASDIRDLKTILLNNNHLIYISNNYFKDMSHLENVVISHNFLLKIEQGAFQNLRVLERLDLSFNNITLIQPGLFKDNVALSKLNLSHNFITALNYGIFRGLVNLQVLDVSFNNICDLKRARFYDLSKIQTLLIDHNRIADVDDDFLEINLRFLSIGHNPLPCEKLVYMKNKYYSNTDISAINIDEHSGDNVDGIICNMYNNVSEVKHAENNIDDNDKNILDIKEILLNMSRKNHDSLLSLGSNNSELLNNISDKLDKYGTSQVREKIQLKNITSQLTHITDEDDRSNSILERILKEIIGLVSLQSKLVAVLTNNITVIKNNVSVIETLKLNEVVSDIKQNNQNLLYLVNVISERDKKILPSRTLKEPLVSDKLNTSDLIVNRNSEKSFVFVEVCVSLILIILVCFILYKFYRSKMCASSSRAGNELSSLCTRNITDAMDNSNL